MFECKVQGSFRIRALLNPKPEALLNVCSKNILIGWREFDVARLTVPKLPKPFTKGSNCLGSMAAFHSYTAFVARMGLPNA